MKTLRYATLFGILLFLALSTVGKDLALYRLQSKDHTHSIQINQTTIETVGAGGESTIKTMKVVDAPIRTWESPPENQIQAFEPLIERCSETIMGGMYIELPQIDILSQVFTLVYRSTNQHKPVLIALSERVLDTWQRICNYPNLASMSNALAAASAYLSLFDCWLQTGDREWARKFELHFDETLALLLSLNAHSDTPEMNLYVQHAYLAAILQRAAAMPLDEPTAFPLDDCVFLADLHTNFLLDKANLSLGIPLWMEDEDITFRTHARCLYALAAYKKAGGTVNLPFTRRQADGALDIFIDVQKKEGVANRFYAYGFWVYPPLGEQRQESASLESVALSVYASRYLGMGSIISRTRDAILSDYMSGNGFTMRPHITNSSKAESRYADALALFAIVNFLYAV